MFFTKLNFPPINIKTKIVEGKMQVFDQIRKKYLVLTNEEWVRQHIISYLNLKKNYPLGLMRVEQMIKYNSMKTRADLVVHSINGSPEMIVECKSPKVKITQDTFYQIAKYNFKLRVSILVVTNGLQHFCCSMDYEGNKICFLNEIPCFKN